MPGGAWGIKPIWPLPLEPCPFPVLLCAPGPRGDICCPPSPSSPPAAQLCSQVCWLGFCPQPRMPPCHICGERLGFCCAPTVGDKEPKSKSSCHFLLVKEDPVPPVPVFLSRGGTNTMMSTLCGCRGDQVSPREAGGELSSTLDGSSVPPGWSPGTGISCSQLTHSQDN